MTQHFFTLRTVFRVDAYGESGRAVYVDGVWSHAYLEKYGPELDAWCFGEAGVDTDRLLPGWYYLCGGFSEGVDYMGESESMHGPGVVLRPATPSEILGHFDGPCPVACDGCGSLEGVSPACCNPAGRGIDLPEPPPGLTWVDMGDGYCLDDADRWQVPL